MGKAIEFIADWRLMYIVIVIGSPILSYVFGASFGEAVQALGFSLLLGTALALLTDRLAR